MKTSMDIDFRLHGEVNGHTFDMDGYGLGDVSAGTCELHLKASPGFPEGFDPVSCPFICSHPTSSFFARPLAAGCDFASATGGDYAVKPARHGILRDAQGKVVLDLEVTGRTYVSNGRLISENLMRGTSHLPRMARNVTPSRDFILPSRAGEATALVRFKMVSQAGEEFDGITVVPYRWAGARRLELPLVRNVADIIVEWNGGPEVSAYYRIDLAPLTETVAAETRPAAIVA